MSTLPTIKKLKSLIESGLYQDAILEANQFLTMEPSNGMALMLKGLAEIQLNRDSDAEQSLILALDHGLHSLDTFHQLAMIYSRAQEFAQADAVMQQGIDLIGEEYVTPEWYGLLSQFYHSIGKYQKCISWTKKLLTTQPSNVLALKRLGSSFLILQKPKDALDIYRQVLDLQPEDPQLHVNLSAILQHLRELEAAQKHLEMAARLDRRYYDPTTLFILAAARLDFQKCEEYRRDALKSLEDGESISDPFAFFFATDDPGVIKRANASYGKKFPIAKRLFTPRTKSKSDGRIRIGYLSADFKEHATSYLIEQLIKEHDRATFHVTGFDFSNNTNRKKPQIHSYFDQHIDLMDTSHEHSAEIIAKHCIDILIDLKGFTEHSRPQILSYRPGKAQVNFLGYPGTTGLDYLDYIIGDSVVFDKNSERHFSEKQITLPCCYQPNNPFRKVAEPTTRNDLGLPEDAFIFSCFNNHWKMTSEILGIWKEILETCSHGILWVMDAVSKTDTKQKLIELGANPDQVFVAPLVPIEKHLSRLRVADLFLDTFPCGAHTTASDSIFGGVPVLSIMGGAFHSRVSASIMIHADCPEFVCESVDEYKSKAIQCYDDPRILQCSRTKLLNVAHHTHPYNLNTTRIAIEKAYKKIVDLGENKRSFKIDPWWS